MLKIVNDKYVEIFVLLESFEDEKSTLMNDKETTFFPYKLNNKGKIYIYEFFFQLIYSNQ